MNAKTVERYLAKHEREEREREYGRKFLIRSTFLMALTAIVLFCLPFITL